jgi:hypothetical protein
MADDEYVDIREVMKKQQEEEHPSFWTKVGRTVKADAIALGRAGVSGAKWIRKEAPVAKAKAIEMYHKEQELQAKVKAGLITAKQKEEQLVKHYNDAMKFLDKERRAFNKIAYHEGKRKHKKSRKKGSRRKLHKVV